MDVEEKSIKSFLEGEDELKYVVAIEGDYSSNEVSLIIDEPERGKRVETHKFKPFAFVKDLKNLTNAFYSNEKESQMKALSRHGITFKKLRTDGEPRLENGYKFLAESSKDNYSLTQFFKGGGVKSYVREDEDYADRGFLSTHKGVEQFMMQSGVRLFKGYEKYSEILKLYFDIETTSLLPTEGNIFLIGISTNRGFKKVLEIDYTDHESEKNMIVDFFQIIHDISPTVICGFNSEAFDFSYILGRAELLGINLGTKVGGNMTYEVRTSLKEDEPIKRKKATVKFGSETENYEQTLMWGYNVIDISHAVRSAKAINSEIKSWSLKYITKFIEANKPTRTYVDGDKIYKTWFENKYYFYNKENYEYKVLPEKFQNDIDSEAYRLKLIDWVDKVNYNNDNNIESIPKLKMLHEFLGGKSENVGVIRGKDIVFNYLLDDLDETQKVDEKFGQANFMLGKTMPTNYARITTMGNSSKWKLLMSTYSLKEGLALPVTDDKRDIVGGLSRLINCGYASNVLKMDYSSLYPSIQLTHDVFPTFDITGVMRTMLSYFKDTRTEFKALAGEYEAKYKITNDPLDNQLASLYDTKQLPVKILNNSQFGAISAPHIFNWGDNHVGETITCTGRQYLRLMVWFFEKNGFKALVGDTDGFNFAMPKDHEKLSYVDKKGKTHTSFKATLAEFNDLYMYGAMKLSLDGLYKATINLARKNYIDLNDDGSIKLVGNSLKSSTLPKFFEEAIATSARFLVNNDGKSFIEEYYKNLELVFTKQVPLMSIASKARVKQKNVDYLYDKQHKKDKNGKAMSKKAHMELLVNADLQPDMGMTVYYVNNGTKVADGDSEFAYLLDENDFISDPNKTGDYNVVQMVSKFNKCMSVFLVCFKDIVRETLIVKTPTKRAFYTDEDMELIAGKPLKVEKQDVMTVEEYEEGMKNEPFMEMSEREVLFWNRVDKDPHEIFPHFTTTLSREKLLTQDEKKIVNEQKVKIINFFSEQDVLVKSETDYIKSEDTFVRYSKLFNYIGDVEHPKTKKITKELLTKELDKVEWMISKYVKGKRIDIEIIPEDIYI